MYRPTHFVVDDAAALAELMASHPLAHIVRALPEGGLSADPIPLLYDARAHTLRGHVARANPLWREASGQPVMALFAGPQAYVSPGHMPEKARSHRVVPTWNYCVVHAHGRLRVHDDAAWLRQWLPELTQVHEVGQPVPWAVTDAPAEHIEALLRAIVGIEIPIDRLEGKFKLSQNKAQAELAGTAVALAQHGTGAQAKEVAARMSALAASLSPRHPT